MPEGTIRLKAFQNDLRFDFSYLSFSQATENKYSFLLENHDQEWRNPSQYNYARYLNVPPGDYVFKVRAANSDGVWNSNEAWLAVSIANPWYQTSLAKIIYVFLFIGILFLIYGALSYKEKIKE